MKNSKVIFLVLITSLNFELFAQNVREIEFSVYGQYPIRNVEYNPVDATGIASGVDPSEPVQIETHMQSRMGSHAFTGIGRIEFFDAYTKQTVGVVSFSSISNKWLFVFVTNPLHKKDPEKQLKYLIYPFDDSEENLPPNSLVFINISGKELDGLLENKRVKLGPGESGSYRVQESLPVNLWTRSFDGRDLLPALIKTYKFKAGHRYLIIFFPPVLRGSVDLDTRLIEESLSQDESP